MQINDVQNLIYAHYKSDDEFANVVRAIAENESASNRHRNRMKLIGALDYAIRNRQNQPKVIRLDELYGKGTEFVEHREPKFKPDDVVLRPDVRKAFDRICLEYRMRDKLTLHGLDSRRKILLHGPSGKTMTSHVLAIQLGLPFYVVRTEELIGKCLGDTGHNVANLFRIINTAVGVYLFDEFDSLSTSRTSERNDVAEMNRVVNALLQLIENDNSASVLLFATNLADSIDFALFRRFDDVIEFTNPTDEEAKRLIVNILKENGTALCTERVVGECRNMSHANITKACIDALKDMILADRSVITEDELVACLNLRKSEMGVSSPAKQERK